MAERSGINTRTGLRVKFDLCQKRVRAFLLSVRKISSDAIEERVRVRPMGGGSSLFITCWASSICEYKEKRVIKYLFLVMIQE